jgi:hypothetical protein
MEGPVQQTQACYYLQEQNILKKLKVEMCTRKGEKPRRRKRRKYNDDKEMNLRRF